ncbi:hypothetical protein M5362_02580 [Streptomyces sp. Je 1-79]|nr:hypothetical protein [Streptomyces sp. Je 1-79]MCT4352023.1 hypothetical protein [Streptomyces sp. Je 1-79]
MARHEPDVEGQSGEEQHVCGDVHTGQVVALGEQPEPGRRHDEGEGEQRVLRPVGEAPLERGERRRPRRQRRRGAPAEADQAQRENGDAEQDVRGEQGIVAEGLVLPAPPPAVPAPRPRPRPRPRPLEASMSRYPIANCAAIAATVDQCSTLVTRP